MTTDLDLDAAIALQRAGHVERAGAAYEAILLERPDDADVLHLLGTIRLHQDKIDEAEGLVRRALVRSDAAIYYVTLSSVLREKKDAEGAVAAAQSALERMDRGEIHHALGLALELAGRRDDAIAAYRAALARDPWLVLAHVSLARALFASRVLDEALAEYMLALFADAKCADARCGVGTIMLDRGEITGAIEQFELALKDNPSHVESHVNVAHALLRAKRIADARTHVDEALRLRPGFGPAQNALGSILLATGKRREAMQAFERGAADGSKGSKLNAAAALLLSGKVVQSRAMVEEELAAHPTSARAMATLAQALFLEGRPAEAVTWAKKAIDADPWDLGPRSFVLGLEQAQSAADPDALFRLACEWGRVASGRHPRMPAPVVDRSPDRPLRVGYVSADFRRHPIGYFLGAVIPEHDKRNVVVHCYSNNPHQDDYTTRFKRGAAWRVVDKMDDAALADLVRSDAIDILVDLSGHTYMNRLEVFVRKPAPIQATWLGYYATTGVMAIDWIIADEVVVPPGEEHRFVERPLRLPGCYVCGFDPQIPLAVAPLPSTRGPIKFGNFNNLTKLSDATIALWCRILRELPGSQLLLKTHFLGTSTGMKQTLDRFKAHGIEEERLLLEGFSPRDELLRTYHHVDIALDPFPYNGGTTTVEAMWMGVPVITNRGSTFVGHVGESLLRGAGLSDLCAANDDDYVAKAVALARDRDRLSSLRATLRDQYLKSPLCDVNRFVQKLEEAYRTMWHRWLEG